MDVSNAKILRRKFHEAEEDAVQNELKFLRRNEPRTVVYSFKMLSAMCDMVENHVVPDGSFSDDDCIAWEILSRLYRHGYEAGKKEA